MFFVKKLKLFTISLFLISVPWILGTSAYLTDVQTLSYTIKTVSQEYLGFAVEANDISEEKNLIPGQVLPFNLRVKNGTYCPIYVFIKLDLDSNITPSIDSGWFELEGLSGVYSLGADGDLLPLEKGAESRVVSDLRVSLNAGNNQSFSILITAYAIQATGINSSTTTPAEIFRLAGGQ